MKFIGIIPARYASTRFPGKPLAMLDGKPVIQHVYEKVATCLEAAYVATDDERIFNAVEAFGGKAVMTRKDHKSGTDRIEEAIEKIGGDWDVIVNVQGDEPFVSNFESGEGRLDRYGKRRFPRCFIHASPFTQRASGKNP